MRQAGLRSPAKDAQYSGTAYQMPGIVGAAMLPLTQKTIVLYKPTENKRPGEYAVSRSAPHIPRVFYFPYSIIYTR